jgi:hypothetical protein
MRAMPFVLFFLLASFAIARDKPPYEVGMFMSSEQVSDGSYSTASCGSFGCNGSAYNAAHNVHLVRTDNGIFSIEAPVSVAGTLLLGMVNNGNAPTVHKAWFMDDLHEGDKVLFSAACNKHNRCTIRLPNPEKPTKEITTLGFFYPAIAKTNTTILCGTGKLTVDVEAQVCAQRNSSPPPDVPSPVPSEERGAVSAASAQELLVASETSDPASPPTLGADSPTTDEKNDTRQQPINEAPKPEKASAIAGFPNRWKSMTTGSVRTLRFEGDYIYSETVLSEAATKAGMFVLMDVKKDGEKYVGKENGRIVRSDRGASCSFIWLMELTLVTPDRIEGRGLGPAPNSKLDWKACTYSPSAEWQTFTWIPVR